MDKIREICRKTAETIEDVRKQDYGGNVLNQNEIVDLLAIFYRTATADGLDEGAKILDAYIMMPHLASRLREEAREFRRQASPTIHVNNPIRKGVLSDDEIDEIERWATGKPLIKEGSIQAFPSSVLKLLQSHKVLADRLKVVEEDRACRVRQVDVLGNQISALGKENQELRVQIVQYAKQLAASQARVKELEEHACRHDTAELMAAERIRQLQATLAERDAAVKRECITQQNMEANGVLYRKAIADKQDLEQQLAASQQRVRELEDKLKEVL